ncbi:MAG: hypothetical protein MUD12_15815 [Spirochaetes bacterium]|jgi:hypothetical protein|nr:hypothetical protein [Spirochaetota bacterium]
MVNFLLSANECRKNVKIALLAGPMMAVMVLALPAPGSAAPRGEDPETVLSRIREKVTVMYDRYIGVEARREIESKQYDSRNFELRTSYRAVVIRKEYFYKKAEYTVLQFFKDGKELPPKKYNFRTVDPVFPPLDRNNDENYRVTVTGKRVIGGRECYELEIVPKKKTKRHLSGKAYFTVNGLDLYYIEGTVADYPFGVKSLEIKLYFKKAGDISVLSHGGYIVKIDIPVFYSHRMFVNTFRSFDDRPIPAPK